jgi:hypothetical protein
MPRVDSSSKAPGHLRESVSFLPSLAEVVVSPDILIHLLKQLLQSLWGLPGEVLSRRSWPKNLDHGLKDNFIRHCGRLCPQPQEPSDICLKVFLMVLRALEQGLGCDLKGKCALGPFLSILVIECQHKCFCVNLCKVVDKVQIKSKGMFLDLVHCFMD